MARVGPPTYEAPAHVIVVRDADDVAGLVDAVLDRERLAPIVALTTRHNESQPALDADDVRAALDPHVPIYLIETGDLTRELEERLPPKLHVFGGAARIWWPGVSDSSDPRDHPLIQDRYGVYGTQTLDHLAHAFAQGPAKSPGEVEHPELELLRRKCAHLERLHADVSLRCKELEGENSRLRSQLAEQKRRTREARREAHDAVPASDAEATQLAGQETDFHRLVFDEWLESTRTDDRSTHPLRAFVLHPSLHDSIEKVGGVDATRVAWVCAMVACGRAPDLAGLAPHALRSGHGGVDPQVVRADGAKAMRCSLKQSTPSAPRLHYWLRTDGVIEFAVVVNHDDFDIPE